MSILTWVKLALSNFINFVGNLKTLMAIRTLCNVHAATRVIFLYQIKSDTNLNFFPVDADCMPAMYRRCCYGDLAPRNPAAEPRNFSDPVS